MKKLKYNLAAQIFIALVLAIIVGLLFGKNPDFLNNYIKPFGHLPEPAEVHRLPHRSVLHPMWHDLHEGHQEGRLHRR